MQFHLEFFIDLDEAEALLHQHGATTPEDRPGPAADRGLRVMLDPAGHPFCIGTPV
jgi:hypothetical protein